MATEQKNNPDNYIPILLENYAAFLDVYTINSVEHYKEKKKDFEERVKLLKNGDESSPYHLYAEAEVHLHAAVLHIKFGEYFAALMDVKKSVKRLEENIELFPNFVANKKSLGTLYTILGSIPEQYQYGLSLFGLKGNVVEGMALLAAAVEEKDDIFQHESATIYAFLELHISNDSEEAWKVLLNNQFLNSESLMDVYTIGHVGIHGNYNDEGIKALLDRPSSADYQDFPYLDFLTGLGLTYKLDPRANTYFQSFLSANQGEDYVKSAWHKMAWNELLSGNEAGYYTMMEKVNSQGRDVIETDKQALHELSLTEPPNQILLKARLLTDGNYLVHAREILESHVVNEFKSRSVKTEYFYRLSRVFHKLKEFEMAKNYYGLTISNGQTIPFYYAANSAYQMGYIYELEEQYDYALSYYEMAMEIDGYEYNNSINQKAKAGINRVKFAK